jgi:CheY-like chemotaxis protein
LVDDDPDDNFYHQIIINEMNIVNYIDVAVNGIEAIAYLKKENRIPPDLIFLDLNMPKMNGWEFLEQYKNLSTAQKASVLIIILTTSLNPDHLKKAEEILEVTGFNTKPLSKEYLTEIFNNILVTICKIKNDVGSLSHRQQFLQLPPQRPRFALKPFGKERTA